MNVPSHGPRKQQLGGLIFGAELELRVGFDLKAFEGLHCDLRRGQERRTWKPGIIYYQSEIKWLINNVLVDRHTKRVVQRTVWDPGITH